MKKLTFLIITFIAFFLSVSGVMAASHTIVVESVDKETGETVKGSGFSMTQPNGYDGEGIPSSSGRWEVTTDKIGTHYLRETHAAAGYLPMEQDVININVATSTASPIMITTYHVPIKVKVTAPHDYTYQMKNASGKVIDTWVQSSKVVHTISKVAVGKYTIKVTKAPSGYEIPKEEWVIEVPANKEINSVTFSFLPTLQPPIPSPTPTVKPTTKPTVSPTIKPSSKPGGQKVETITNVPNTKVSQSMIFYGLGSLVIFSGVGMIYKRAKQN